MFDKTFIDILKEYQELKFICEYGFPWNDEIMKILFQKTTQSSRNISVLLEGNPYKDEGVWNVDERIFWKKIQEGAKSSKLERKVLSKNLYHSIESSWYQNIYGCYGKTNLDKDKCDRCSKSHNGNCAEMRGCKLKPYYLIKCWRDVIVDSIQKKTCIAYQVKSEFDDQYFYKNYLDILDKDKNKNKRMKNNTWTENSMNFFERDKDEYKNFLKMLSFFSMTAPLYVLGYHFLRRLGEETIHPYIFVRDREPDYVFESERIYRCLCAIHYQHYICMNGKQYIPIRLFYQDVDLWNNPVHLYLKAKEKDTGIIEDLLLSGEKYFYLGNKIQEGIEKIREKEKKLEKIFDFTVTYLFNDIGNNGITTEYLERRRKLFESYEIGIKSGTPQNVDSPYYPNNKEWKTTIVTYKIPKRDVQGFLDFVKSFGDFAYLNEYTEYPIEEPIEEITSSSNTYIKEEYSLCNNYSSNDFINKLDKGKLPARAVEVAWIEFILNEYPNLCLSFITQETIDELKGKIEEENKNLKEEWFSKKYWDFTPKIHDIRKGTSQRYKIIFKKIEEKELIYASGKNGKKKTIYPYALEYRTINKQKKETSFEIMGYNLEDKRNVLIAYKDSIAYDACLGYQFSNLDKLYHILAVAVRYGIEAKDKIISKDEEPPVRVEQVLNCIWDSDERNEKTIYERKIRKKIQSYQEGIKKEPKKYENLYDSLLQIVEEKDKEFVKNVFGFWKDTFEIQEDSDNEKIYYTFLLECFKMAYGELSKEKINIRRGRPRKTNPKSILIEILKLVKNDEIWKMIIGENTPVLNEIAFYNERLKNAKLSFKLLNENVTKENIEKVYQVFSNFLCTGEWIKDDKNKGIYFTVLYEKFYYRKIHMGLMILCDEISIEDIIPESTKKIIKQRIKNKKIIHMKNNTYEK